MLTKLKTFIKYSILKRDRYEPKLDGLTRAIEYNNSLLLIYPNKKPDNKIAHRVYDKNIFLIYQYSLGEKDVVFDIGANAGFHTIQLSRCVGDNGIVYAFEPVDYLCKQLNANLVLNKATNIEIISKAVGDKNSTLKFYQVSEDSIYHDNSSAVINEKLIKLDKGMLNEKMVEQTSIDQFCKLKNIQRVNLIKIDVEGYELQVLLGAKKIIKKFKPIIIFEYLERRLKFLAIDNRKYSDIFSDNYDLYEIGNYNDFNESFYLDPFNFDRKVTYGNILCIPKKY